MAFALKISVLMLALTMVMTITITMKAIPELDPKPKPSSLNHADHQYPRSSRGSDDDPILTPSVRVSRFLAVNNTNPRATTQCKKDNNICIILGGSGGRCCQNTCVDLLTNRNNCGSCKKKCKFTETCCRGKCVMTAFDKRHCGKCNNRCPVNQLCVYGMCNYG
ncbi:hypothetical protein SAY87_021290 [Trapa incisa]|uniref:Stigma-specific STIG1-like protein 1 n=2 Tax=Trapa TaxID=22665 RepID=A0AAN7MUB2_TRANT|nr:hypothetical protein SAY87_021290 [Trapa incisa]KAK4804157.1 hypothetical protein SAY86_003974 [Trapa natans]